MSYVSGFCGPARVFVAILTISLATVALALLTATDAEAVPFFAKRTSSSALATIQDEGSAPGLMTGYTKDIQSGLGDFAFLARNFSGANPSNRGSPPGLIGPEPEPIGIDVPASAPGSVALLALGGGLLLLWRRKHT